MIFGSCKDITIGPTAIMSIMTQEYANFVDCNDAEQTAMAVTSVAILLTFLAGFIILLASIFRIGE